MMETVTGFSFSSAWKHCTPCEDVKVMWPSLSLFPWWCECLMLNLSPDWRLISDIKGIWGHMTVSLIFPVLTGTKTQGSPDLFRAAFVNPWRFWTAWRGLVVIFLSSHFSWQTLNRAGLTESFCSAVVSLCLSSLLWGLTLCCRFSQGSVFFTAWMSSRKNTQDSSWTQGTLSLSVILSFYSVMYTYSIYILYFFIYINIKRLFLF